MNNASLFNRIFAMAVVGVTWCGTPSLLAWQVPSAPDKRAISIKPIKELPAKAKRFALVIGVDDYQDTQIGKLECASNDAKALADALVQYAGFPRDQVILLASDQPIERRPLRGNILQYLSNLRGLVPEDGLLLVSFAGHGIERERRAYLCPTDARIGGNIALLEATAVSVEMMREWIRDAGVKQVLVILDACRNNPFGRGEENNRLTESYARNFNFDVRNGEVVAFATFYATAVGSVAYEYKEKKHGYFTWALIEGLKGAAANERGEVTLARLRDYLQEAVPKQVRLDLGTERKQTPFAAIEGYKAEELVLAIAPSASVASATDSSIELRLWDAVKDSKYPDDYKAYLAKYPNGIFARVAYNRISNLEAAPDLGSRPKIEPKAAEVPIADENRGASANSGKSPYQKDRLLRVVQLNALPTTEIVQAIHERGVSFQMSSDIESEFRATGARSEIIEAVRANYRSTTGSKPYAGVPSGPALSKTEITTLLMSGVPSARIEQFVRSRGVAFTPTPEDTDEIRKAGGADSLILTIGTKSMDNLSRLGRAQVTGPDYDDLTDQAVAAMQSNNTNASISLLQQATRLDSSKPQAYGLLGFAQLYGSHDVVSAERSMRAAIERGGGAPFRVYHDHDGFFNKFCQGSLFVSKLTVTYKADDGIHSFGGNLADIKEAKINAFVGSQYGAFHLKVSASGKPDNYTFAPATRQKAESNLIINLINGYR